MADIKLKVLADRLFKIRGEILLKFPFFGRLLLRLPFGFADCGTAYTDMQRIVFDPDFASGLSDDQLTFVLLHELMHCVLKHCTRGRGKIHSIYNIACDIVVNSLILEALSLRRVRIRGVELMHIAPDGAEGRKYTAERVYEMLLGAGNPNIETDDGFSAYGDDGDGSAEAGKGGSGSGSLGGKVDRHDVWEEITDSGILEDIWDSNIREASKNCGTGSGIPNALERFVERIDRQAKISWQNVLRDFLQFDRSDFHFSPPDRRYTGDCFLPSFVPEADGTKIENIWFAVDTSGSVSKTMLSEAFEEIRDAIEQIGNVEGMISFFDCKVSVPQPFSSIEDIEKIKPIGGGGTSITEVFAFLGSHFKDEKPRVAVIITDGYAPMPSEESAMGVPVLWIITDSEVEPPFGEVIHIYSR